MCQLCKQVLRRQRPQSKIEVAEVNLSSLASVRAFCKVRAWDDFFINLVAVLESYSPLQSVSQSRSLRFAVSLQRINKRCWKNESHSEADPCVQAFNAQNLPLDFLILNAGIMATDGIRRTTPDGLEEHFQVRRVQ